MSTTESDGEQEALAQLQRSWSVFLGDSVSTFYLSVSALNQACVNFLTDAWTGGSARERTKDVKKIELTRCSFASQKAAQDFLGFLQLLPTKSGGFKAIAVRGEAAASVGLHPLPLLLPLLGRLEDLQSLEIYYQTEKEQPSLGERLRGYLLNPKCNLATLKLLRCLFTESGWQDLSAGLRGSLQHSLGLRNLWFQGCGIDDRKLSMIALDLAASQAMRESLTVLNIGQNKQITSTSIPTLVGILGNFGALESLLCRGCPSLFHGVADAEFNRLLHSVRSSPKLQVLRLSACDFPAAQVASLMQAVSESRTIEDVALSSRRMDHARFAADVLPVLQQNTRLLVLNEFFTNNTLGAETYFKVRNIIDRNKLLCVVPKLLANFDRLASASLPLCLCSLTGGHKTLSIADPLFSFLKTAPEHVVSMLFAKWRIQQGTKRRGTAG